MLNYISFEVPKDNLCLGPKWAKWLCCHKNALCKSSERFIGEIGIEMVGRVNYQTLTMWDNSARFLSRVIQHGLFIVVKEV